MTYVTKTQQAKDLINAGDLKGGLKIVQTFRALPREDKKLFGQCWEAMVHPSFYKQTRGEAWIHNTIEAGLQRLREWAAQ